MVRWSVVGPTRRRALGRCVDDASNMWIIAGVRYYEVHAAARMRAGGRTTHDEYMKVLASTGRVIAAAGGGATATTQQPMMRTMMISVADADGEDVGVLRHEHRDVRRIIEVGLESDIMISTNDRFHSFELFFF